MQKYLAFKLFLGAFSIVNAFLTVSLFNYIYGVAEAVPEFVKLIGIIYVGIPLTYLYKIIIKK